jgi:uncharacterized Zn finger protein
MKRRVFGQTWWGKQWIYALEERASLDRNRLPRGRTYARQETVGGLAISRGQITASVKGRRPNPYKVVINVATFKTQEWDRVIDSISAQVGRLAALLDGELPAEVVKDVEKAGCDLLPGAGEIKPRCSCPDWADPCKHAAAVCYLVADAVDADPFALLLLRGRSRDEILATLRARRGKTAAVRSTPTGPTGVVARAAYAAHQDLPRLPGPQLPPSMPGQPAPLPVDPPADSGVPTDVLAALVADAAGRAWELAAGLGDGGLTLDPEIDLARRASGMLGSAELPALARRLSVPPKTLVTWAIGWREAVAGGVAVVREDWSPAPQLLEPARRAMTDWGGSASAQRNRVTCGDVQLRLGQDGRWYRLLKSSAGWDVDGPAADDPADLIDND